MYKKILVLCLYIIFFGCKESVIESNELTKDELTIIDRNELTILQKKEMLDLINKSRTTGCNCGSTYMPPVEILTWNEKLEIVAILHSEDMFKNDYFEHINKQGVGPSVRITNAGYIWSICGENIAKLSENEATQSNVVKVMNDWMNSEGHCKNIMNKNFKEIGAGRIDKLWTQNFGTKLTF